jgi:diguanylate cyclase (GGDEF)-like protein
VVAPADVEGRAKVRTTLQFMVAVSLLCLGAGGTSRASESVDLHRLAQAYVPARCPASGPQAIARLPSRCFIPMSEVPEALGDTYVTPPTITYRVVVPADVADGDAWDLHLDFMVDRGTLSDVSPEGVVRAQIPLGMDIPVDQRPVRTYDDRIPLPTGMRPGDALVLTLESTITHFVVFELRTPESLRDIDETNAAVYYGPMAFINGMLLAMALFNLLLYALLRKRYYLLYSLSMLAMILFQTVQSGVAWTWLWPGLPVRDDAPAYVAYLIYFTLVTAFTRSFLDLRRVAPVVDTVLLCALGGLALDAVLYVGFPGLLAVTHLWDIVDPIAVTFMIGALLAAGVAAWQRHVVSARYYVIGFGGAALGLILGEAADYTLISLGVWHDLCSAIGVAWEAIFLAFALAERIRLAERETLRLTDYAYRDQLTGISNRRAFDEALENEWRRNARSGRPLSLLMVDIDHFKSYNDRFGHQQGDVALRAVATEIQRVARRPGDFAGRYGGEEFAIVLSETTAEGAFTSAQAVRRAIRALGIAFDDRALTVSVGCATVVPVEGESSAGLIAAADAALYAAKTAGRDRTMAAEATTSTTS